MMTESSTFSGTTDKVSLLQGKNDINPVEVKICGITRDEETAVLNELNVDYAGMVLFFEKSPRNIPITRAAELVKMFKTQIKKVAVMVSPDISQIKEIELAGFDYIQIHKEMSEEVYEEANIPIIRAINIGSNPTEELVQSVKELLTKSKIQGILFDAGASGSGKTFDWEIVSGLLDTIKASDKKLFLAGGLTCDNIKAAIENVSPDAVDVSSGVEYDRSDGIFKGKNPELVKRFVKEVRS